MNFQSNVSTKKQVFLFFGFTYLFSWLMFLISGSLNSTPFKLIAIWGPTIISFLLTYYFYGKKGVSHLFGRLKRVKNIKWYYWLALILLPATIHFVGRSIWQLYYYNEIVTYVIPLEYWARAIIPSFIIAGFGEEFGWRGFALPRLQKNFSPMIATLILAVFHLFWHLPAYWLGGGIHTVPGIYVLGFVFPWTVIFVWLYNKSNGSILFAVGFHAISNASLSIVGFMPSELVIPITPDLLTRTSLPAELSGPYLSVVGVYCIAAILVLRFGNFNKVNTDLP